MTRYDEWIKFCRALEKKRLKWWQRLLVRIHPNKLYFGIDASKGGDEACRITYKIINNKFYILDIVFID